MIPDGETRDRLLLAGGLLFADHGYRRVTVREICRAARANVAAINYYFGGKLGLYREVIDRAIGELRETTARARKDADGLSPEARLRVAIHAYLRLMITPGTVSLHRLMQREMQDPTPSLDAIIERGIKPRLDDLAAIVADMTGRSPDDPDVLRCVGSIQIHTVLYLPNRVRDRLGYGFEPTPEHIEDAADYVTAFSIGGIRAITGTRAAPPGARAR